MDILSFDKVIYHFDRLGKMQAGEPQFPVHITISLGNLCNHRCLWCSVYAQLQKDVQLTDVDRLLAFLEKGAARGLKAVSYVGNGEPTAHPRAKELFRRVHEMGIEQGMFTNGYLLDRVMDEVLDGFTFMRFSLDAGSPAMHAEMHDVPDAQFPKIMENMAEIIRRRKADRPTIGVQYAVHHRNLPNMYESARKVAEIGADYFSVKPVFNKGSVGERIEKNQLTLEELSPEVSRIRKDIESRTFEVHFRPFQILSEEADENVLKYDRCVAGFFNLNLYEDGSLVYCAPHRIPVGHMDDDLDQVERNIVDLSTKLDLSKCPGGCRYHPLNHLVHTVVKPGEADPYHRNFL